MKSYKQYCGLALALDHIGDRWTLLIVRELLTGAKRFSDLQDGLPGVASNLLAERLRRMEEDGLLRREELHPPRPATLYELTDLGAGLQEPIEALARWGGRWMIRRDPEQAFRPEWLAIAFPALLREAPLPREMTIALQTPEGRTVLTAEDGKLTAAAGPLADAPGTTGDAARGGPAPDHPDCALRGEAQLILGVAAGVVSWKQAEKAGLEVTGDEESVARLRSVLGRNAEGEAGD